MEGLTPTSSTLGRPPRCKRVSGTQHLSASHQQVGFLPLHAAVQLWGRCQGSQWCPGASRACPSRPELRGTRTGACALAILVPPVPATCAPLPAPVSPQSKPYRQQPPKKPDLRATGLSLSTVYGTEMIIFYDSTISDSTMSFCTDFQGDRMQHVSLHPTGVAAAADQHHWVRTDL